MLKHIVCWKLKEYSDVDSKNRDLLRMKELLESLPAKITELKHLEVGINFNTSDTAFDISIYSVFENELGLEAYQKHPAHLEAGTFIKSITQKRAVVDYLH